MREVLSSRIGEKMMLPGGGFISSEYEEDPLKLAEHYGRTAKHESLHANAEPDLVVEASIIPEGDSLGHVQYTEHSDVGAVAAHAYGMDGTSYDLSTVIGSIEGAAATARARLDREADKVDAFARYLEANGTATGADLRRVRNVVDHGYEVTVSIETPTGRETRIIRAGIYEEHVMIPGEWVSLEYPEENPAVKNQDSEEEAENTEEEIGTSFLWAETPEEVDQEEAEAPEQPETIDTIGRFLDEERRKNEIREELALVSSEAN
jgi:hypothetical protein